MNKLIALSALFVLSFSLTACASEGPASSTEGGTEEETETTEAQMGEEIVIATPAAGETVSSPFEVTGTTDSPNATIKLTSYGSDGLMNSEAEWRTEADGSFDFGSTYYFIGGGGEGRVEVVLLDEEGNETDRAVVPVVFE